jgi:hypothetical protein
VDTKTLFVGNAQRVATKGGADRFRPGQKEVASVRRIKLVVAVGVVMAAMVALMAGPAMADDFDLDVDDVDFLGNNGVLLEGDDDEEFFVVDEDEGLFDALCSPGIDIDLTGCVFSDSEDDDFLDEDNEIDFVSLDDNDLFDDDDEVDFRFDDDDDRHDNNNNDNERSFTRIIDRD